MPLPAPPLPHLCPAAHGSCRARHFHARECHSTAHLVAMDVNGRFQIQLADGELISVKPCKLKPLAQPLPLPKQQAARAINWAEYSQLESRVRSLDCADSTHSAAATLARGAKKEHRSAKSRHAACTRASTAAQENIEACETSWCATPVLPTPNAALAPAQPPPPCPL